MARRPGNPGSTTAGTARSAGSFTVKAAPWVAGASVSVPPLRPEQSRPDSGGQARAIVSDVSYRGSARDDGELRHGLIPDAAFDGCIRARRRRRQPMPIAYCIDSRSALEDRCKCG